MRRRIESTPSHICSLRPFGTLDNFEFNGVPFLQGFVSLAYDSGVVDKYIWTVIAPDEAVAFRVMEPFDCAFHHSTTHSITNVNICSTGPQSVGPGAGGNCIVYLLLGDTDRKSTRLNSSHQIISYAVFCLKKK